ncbi:MAG TPA: hypothetical protein PLX89_26120 [Verrucomicrobiota bacterium]|nr:hypothetical protein [Verrucomicrobiales bacterium]HRI16486.1 hypothetical protein [Verrucomicrobiota bacterium]
MLGPGKLAVAILGGFALMLAVVRAEVPSAGLLHWWPDPAEGTDQVTGRRGVQRGFGPLPGSENRFGSAAGWVELGPGITNETFTLTCWLRPGVQTYPSSRAIVSQDSGLGDGWSLRDSVEGEGAEFASHSFGETPRNFCRWDLANDWQAVALRVSPEFVQAWSNGVPVKRLHMNLNLSAKPGSLCVGNVVTGQMPWEGDLRDLRLYDRLLTDREIQDIARTPRSAAKAIWPGEIVAAVNQTKITPARPADYQRQSFGTDRGLPSAEVQTIAQASDGALFLGFEAGLVRYDGWRFPVVADAASPEFAVTGPDVGAMAFAPSGDLWLGQFHGVVRRGRASWQAYPNLGAAGFIRRVSTIEFRAVGNSDNYGGYLDDVQLSSRFSVPDGGAGTGLLFLFSLLPLVEKARRTRC